MPSSAACRCCPCLPMRSQEYSQRRYRHCDHGDVSISSPTDRPVPSVRICLQHSAYARHGSAGRHAIFRQLRCTGSNATPRTKGIRKVFLLHWNQLALSRFGDTLIGSSMMTRSVNLASENAQDRNVLQIAVVAAACIGVDLAATSAWAMSDNSDSPSTVFDEAFRALDHI